jgi:hypothetical protein
MKEKVRWRLEFSLDNFFNITITLLTLGIVIYDMNYNPNESVIGFIIFPLMIQLYINLSSRMFFNKNKYE